MAFVNSDGKSISYECSDLIKELKIEFSGDKIVNAWCKESEGVILYTNYDFIDKEDPIDESELEKDEFIKQMTMNALLIVLEKQNKII
jgi:hypothetical protein